MRYKSKAKKIWKATMAVIGGIISLGIAGAFISGNFMNPFLGFLPLLVHKIVGWIIIAGVVFGVIDYFMKLFKR
jgi:purine-cytosine permease-like protein